MSDEERSDSPIRMRWIVREAGGRVQMQNDNPPSGPFGEIFMLTVTGGVEVFGQIGGKLGDKIEQVFTAEVHASGALMTKTRPEGAIVKIYAAGEWSQLTASLEVVE